MSGPRAIPRVALEIAAAPRVRRALTVAVFGSSFAAGFLRAFWGWPGTIAVLAALVAMCALSLAGARGTIDWRGILPISLLALGGWVALSTLLSQYTTVTVLAILATAGYAFLGVYVALARDLIQTVRSLGDALRAVLVVSLVLEVLAGILLDMPFPFLGIEGDLAVGGPIQGIFGDRNQLGFVAGLAFLTFWVETRTRSVSRVVGIGSLVLAGLMVILSGSPVTVGVLLVVGGVGLVLLALRRIPLGSRPVVQTVFFALLVVAVIVVALLRSRVFALLDATSDFDARVALWMRIRDWASLHAVEGWGWVGAWPDGQLPYSALSGPGSAPVDSALNAYVDAWLQIGLVGAALLIGALALGFVRAWLVASSSRITVDVWPALTLTLLAVTSLAESYLLVEGGLVVFVAACIAAARRRSWRGLLRDPGVDEGLPRRGA
ncbi:MAG: O-antigen ligase family protein [Actinomycetales bacterium]|nr:O-antigen ligase family protein [Actinomycetales bacterium]